MVTQPPTILLDHYLKQLKLPTMLREYQSVAALCAREGQDHIAYLARLVERELIDRPTAMDVAPNRDALRMALKGIEARESGML